MNPKDFYEQGKSDRQNFIDRAILNAELTLPYIIRDKADVSTTAMADSYGQSFGGRAVNSLKAKIGMSLMPPASSSFKLEPTMAKLIELGRDISVESEGEVAEDEAVAQLWAEISRGTSLINKEIDAQSIRDTVFEIVNQLLVVGAVVIEKIKDDGIHYHPLSSFVVKLDNRGNAVKICIFEKLFDLPDGFTVKEEKDEYELYTLMEMEKGTGAWTLTQQIDDQVLEAVKTYTKEKFPFKYTGWTYMVGDHYHRPFVEDYFEDLKQFSDLSHSITDGSIAAAKTFIFVNPRGGRTNIAQVAKAKNLAIMSGSSEDVSAFQLGKNYDFQVSYDTKAELKQNLAAAFLMNESATREAERVTAAEIQFMAQELESSTLAGVYSKLSENVVGWITKQVIGEMGLTLKDLGVKMVVGLDALGRSSEARNFEAFLSSVLAIGAEQRINQDEAVRRFATYNSVETTNLIKTTTELKKEQAEAQQNNQQAILDESGAESLGKEAGKVAAGAADRSLQEG